MPGRLEGCHPAPRPPAVSSSTTRQRSDTVGRRRHRRARVGRPRVRSWTGKRSRKRGRPRPASLSTGSWPPCRGEDTVGHREPEPGAARALGGEERIEDPLRGHALGDARRGSPPRSPRARPQRPRRPCARSRPPCGIASTAFRMRFVGASRSSADRVDRYDGARRGERRGEVDLDPAIPVRQRRPRARWPRGSPGRLVQVDGLRRLVAAEPRELLQPAHRAGAVDRRALDDVEPLAQLGVWTRAEQELRAARGSRPGRC